MKGKGKIRDHWGRFGRTSLVGFILHLYLFIYCLRITQHLWLQSKWTGSREWGTPIPHKPGTKIRAANFRQGSNESTKGVATRTAGDWGAQVLCLCAHVASHILCPHTHPRAVYEQVQVAPFLYLIFLTINVGFKIQSNTDINVCCFFFKAVSSLEWSRRWKLPFPRHTRG